jgi:nanoRNase/pAp phosphatase (c-di-AMP/oligoRNAs hydrolase)
MSLNHDQQFRELLRQSTHPLVLVPPFPSRDDVATALALALAIETMGKPVTVAGDRLPAAQQNLGFLQSPKEVRASLAGTRDFVLSFNTDHNKILGTRTAQEGSEFRIYLTPERGAIDPRDFSFIPAKYMFDLAIIIGASDKEHLGKIYEENPDIFYEMPLVNIDNHSENELFGQVNLVQLTASSKAEIITGFFERTDGEGLTEPVAEALFTGIVTATESFQKKNTTPQALRYASYLMEHGVDQQKIIRALYKTQPLHLLKLWGRVMAAVRWEENERLIWAPVSIEDLVQARARVEELPVVLEKLRGSYSAATAFAVLFQEDSSRVKGFLQAAQPEQAIALKEKFPGAEVRDDLLVFDLTATTLAAAETEFLQRFRAIK